MTQDSTIDLGRSGDETRAWNSKDEEAKHYARAFVGEILGGFKIIKEIGHGSMGIVFLAAHVEDARQAAVKILPPSLSVTTTVIKRFLREAESVKKLEHESIVRVFAVGEERGIHFYAMQFVEGASLDKALRQRRFSVRECATIIAEAARGLFFAHEAGIIHRDIKPANIILTLKDRPILTDFGLAKPEKAATLTESGALVGTPIYMSPEQVRADKSFIDRRTDIYSLGITLYEMLTGVTPFEGTSTQEILNKIESEEPTALRKMRPDVPKALETICHKAIEKEANRRYSTAIEFALDLDRFMRGEPILAKPRSIASRVVRRVRRHPVVFGLSCALVLAFGAVLVQSVRNRGQREVTIDAKYEAALNDGMGLKSESKYSAAIDTLTTAATLNPNRPEAYVERGVCYYYLESYEKAIADFDTALRMKSDYHRAKLWRGITKCTDGTQKTFLEGTEDLKETLHVMVDDPECLFLSSRQCLDFARSGASPIARDSFINTVDQRLQKLFVRIEEIKKDAAANHKTIRLTYDRDEALVLRGLLYETQGLLDEAYASYREALKFRPENSRARALLGTNRAAAKSESEKTNPSMAVAGSSSTWFAVLATEGLAWATKRLESDPNLLRSAAESLNVYKESALSAFKAPELPKDVTPATLDQDLVDAENLWSIGKEKEAVAKYERVLQYMPNLVEPCCRLAEHYLVEPSGIEKAILYTESALKINATNPGALAVAVRVYSKAGQKQKVTEVASAIAKVHPALLSRPDILVALKPYVDAEALKANSDAGKSDGGH